MRIAAIGKDSGYYAQHMVLGHGDEENPIAQFESNDELLASLSQKTDLVIVIVRKPYTLKDATELIDRLLMEKERPWIFLAVFDVSEKDSNKLPLADFISVGIFINDYLDVLVRIINSKRPEPRAPLGGRAYFLGRTNTIIVQILESFGFEVSAFKDKELFIKAVQGKKPDAVLVTEINTISEEYKSLLKECKKNNIRIVGLDSDRQERIKFFDYTPVKDVGDKYLDYCDHFRDEFHIIIDDIYELFSAIKRNEKSNVLMYNKAVLTGVFDKRSLVTANLGQELKFIRKTLRKYKCRKVLDAGCGNGRLSIPLAHPEQGLIFTPKGFEVIGGDVNKTLLEQAKSNSPDKENPKFIYCDIKNIPFPEGTFDAVLIMWHVICEFNDTDREQVIDEAHRVLKNQGIFILDVPLEYKPGGGKYYNKVQGVETYQGRVPSLPRLISDLEQRGRLRRFSIIRQLQVKWGMRKAVIVAQKFKWH